MIVDLQHAGVVELLHLVLAALRRVPGRGIGWILLVEAPEQVDQPLDIGGRHGLADDDVTLGDPVLPVLFREHTQRQAFFDVLQLGFCDGSGVTVSEHAHGLLCICVCLSMQED
ncbi:hypothetical protein D3C86_1852350 [compost metagenome]